MWRNNLMDRMQRQMFRPCDVDEAGLQNEDHLRLTWPLLKNDNQPHETDCPANDNAPP